MPASAWRHLCESETTNGLTVPLFCDVHIYMGTTLNLPACYLWMQSYTNFIYQKYSIELIVHYIQWNFLEEIRMKKFDIYNVEKYHWQCWLWAIVTIIITSSGLPPLFHDCTSGSIYLVLWTSPSSTHFFVFFFTMAEEGLGNYEQVPCTAPECADEANK